MMIWIVLAAIGAVMLFAVFKFQKFHTDISHIFVLAVVLVLVLSVTYVYVTYKPDLSTFDGLVYFLKSYSSWVFGVFSNTGKIAGYVINQNWSQITNSTVLP